LASLEKHLNPAKTYSNCLGEGKGASRKCLKKKGEEMVNFLQKKLLGNHAWKREVACNEGGGKPGSALNLIKWKARRKGGGVDG